MGDNRPKLGQNSHGDAVRDVQQRLSDAGFDPGAIDGVFGPKTGKAVAEFQKAQGISPITGGVGPKTWAALDKISADAKKPAEFELDGPAGKNPDAQHDDAGPAAQNADEKQAHDDDVVGPGGINPDLKHGHDDDIVGPGGINPESKHGGPPARPPPPTLKRGAKGPQVRELQGRLTEAGFNPGPIDGVYGGMTKVAVQHLQAACGLPETGEMDAETWKGLDHVEEDSGLSSGHSGNATVHKPPAGTLYGAAWRHNVYVSGEHSEMMVKAPGLDGRSVHFTVEKIGDDGAWTTYAVVTAKVQHEVAHAKVPLKHDEKRPTRLRFTCMLDLATV